MKNGIKLLRWKMNKEKLRLASKEEVAESLHILYEESSKIDGWKTQENCRVEFKDLPEDNKKVMLLVSESILKNIENVKKLIIQEEREKIFKGLKCPKCNECEDFEEAYNMLINHIENIKKEFGVEE